MKAFLVVVAVVCFALATFGVSALPHLAWVPLGLGLWSGSTLVK